MKKFYTHLIEIESLTIELDKMDLSESERAHLGQLIDQSLHQTILDAVLSELSEEDKHTFLTHLKDENHDEIWKLLNGRVENIEDKIKKTAEELKKELHEDIKEGKKK